MWDRKQCAVCGSNFGVHPKANTTLTRQLCNPCRKIRRWTYAINRRKEIEDTDTVLYWDTDKKEVRPVTTRKPSWVDPE